MGMFSWSTYDTNKSICNRFSNKKPFTVYMKYKDIIYKEDNYEGYGVFGGKDYFEFISEINGFTLERSNIIDAYYNDNDDNIKNFPIFVEDKDTEWVNKRPEECQFQGYFY
jgi:hypothetical protein